MSRTGQRQWIGYGVIALICLSAFYIAVMAAPVIAAKYDYSEDAVSYVLAAVVFVFIAVSSILVRSIFDSDLRKR
jgi:hypothetical protein